ncbi:NUDIX hydrolase [Ornithinibacillus scapharcae]|uniref:NUDIX hydrolase n=1 Tax=Ornithinibacillus scapharcae TaxID=1147159 RepID=UPI000225ADBD|nr:NUDIX domain-containing protein [Ornithinibacillus scapharcae]
METWDLYDIHRNKIKRKAVRGEELQPGEYHLVVHVCIFNANGEMLIQQRQPFKEGWPNMWDVTAGGSAVAGDTSQIAAERELYEEIGLKVDLQHKSPHLTINTERVFNDIYLVEKNVNLHTLKLQEEEVQAVKWASLDEIFVMIRQGEFIPYYESFIQFLFDSRKKLGVRQI